METKAYHWILLDLDNTIFDFSTSSKLAFSAFLNDFDIVEQDDYYRLYEKVNTLAWRKLETGEIDSDEVKWRRFMDFFKSIGSDKDPHQANECYLDHLVDNFRFIHQAEDIVDYLSKYYKLAAVTNGLKKVQRPRLFKSGIMDAFSTVVVSEEVGVAKPQKAFFDVAFKSMGSPFKDRVMIIGDNLSSDIKGGLDYGIATCWYNHEQIENETEFLPHFEVKKLKEVKEIL